MTPLRAKLAPAVAEVVEHTRRRLIEAGELEPEFLMPRLLRARARLVAPLEPTLADELVAKARQMERGLQAPARSAAE